jgi:hypothetical protein
MQQKKRYRQLRKSKRSPLLEMQEQPFKRLFFFCKNRQLRDTDQKPPTAQARVKNLQLCRFRPKTVNSPDSDQKSAFCQENVLSVSIWSGSGG